MAMELRAEEACAGLENAVYVQILHAVVGAHGGIVARAVKIGLQDFAEPVQVELVRIERVVEEHDVLAEADRDVHGHRDRRDDAGTLIDKIDELTEGKVA